MKGERKKIAVGILFITNRKNKGDKMKQLENEHLNEYAREVVVNYRGQRRKSPTFKNALSVVNFLRNALTDNSREHFIVLFLSNSNQVIGYTVSIGTEKSCSVSPTQIFQKAVMLGASSIVLAHNHPSENLTPSIQDDGLTQVIAKGAGILCIRLLDHIIFTESEFYSYAENNRLNSPIINID